MNAKLPDVVGNVRKCGGQSFENLRVSYNKYKSNIERKMKKIVLMIVPALICGMVLMAGCEKQDLNLNGFDNIIGCWKNPVYEDNTDGKSILCYERSNSLPANSGGIEFLKNGTLVERKNAGWCGTPPIFYNNFSGEWQIQDNDEIKIDVAYWGGMEHRIWKIINVTGSTLKIEVMLWESDM